MFFRKIIFEPAALKTDFGRALYDSMLDRGLMPEKLEGRGARAGGLQSDDAAQNFREGKRTLLIGARNPSRFESCRPSAQYQLPLLTGCPGMCEYCYLMTRMGDAPYVKLNANIVNILTIVGKYIEQNMPDTTSFELSASSDPIPFEEPTGIVSKMVSQFAGLPSGRLRICTKFEPDESILLARHNGHTDFRFSVNTQTIIDRYEHLTPRLAQRIAAARKTADAGYKTGIMIAPVFVYENWRAEYSLLLDQIKEELEDRVGTFEVVTHRYTQRAKETIEKIFPTSTLDLENTQRKFRMGQFGYGKYVYTADQMNAVKSFFVAEIPRRFRSAKLLYVV